MIDHLITRRHRRLLLATIAVVSCTGFGVPNGGASAAPGPGSAKPEAASYSIDIDKAMDVHADRTAVEVATTRIKVLTEAAVQEQGQQVGHFVEGMTTLDIVDAYTEKSDGRRIAVDPADIITRDAASGLAATIVRDLKAKIITFPELAVGDTIVLTTRIETKSTNYAGHFFDMSIFGRHLPYANVNMRITAPKDLPLTVAAKGEGLDYQAAEEGNTVLHLVTYHPMTRTYLEPGQTSFADRDPRIVVTTFKDYEDLGRSYWTGAAPRAAVTPEIKALAGEITKGIDDRRTQAAAIDQWVKHNIRYVAVYLGTGGVVPNSAARILKTRYGDCKDHVTLMSALLAVKGIESDQVLIYNGDVYAMPEPASPAFINHVMLYLPEFGIYDDPTATFAAFGVLDQGDYDKPVIHVSANGVHLGQTPPTKVDEHTSTARTQLTIAADGAIAGETTEITTGLFATASRQIAQAIRDMGPEKAAEARLRKNGTPGAGHYEIATTANFTEPFVLKGSFTLNEKVNTSSSAKQSISLGLSLMPGPGTAFFNDRYDGRRASFHCLAGRMADEIDMTFAEGMPLPKVLNPETVENQLFTYTATYQLDGRTLKVRHAFESRVPRQVCAPEVEAEIAGQLKTVQESLSAPLTFAATEPSASVKPAPDRRSDANGIIPAAVAQ